MFSSIAPAMFNSHVCGLEQAKSDPIHTFDGKSVTTA